MRYFETQFLEEADLFISTLNVKAIKKLLYNIDIAEQTNDPRLFKKLQGEIWEYRIRYDGLQIRLLAFWDKTGKKETLVLATHGFIKKQTKFRGMKCSEQKILEKDILKIKTKNSIMAKAQKVYALSEMKDKYIGKIGTVERDLYEYELNMDVLGRMIKTARQERNLTQEELGKLVGVQKAQISKLESSANSATIDTILKVFKALKADIQFNVTIENQHLQLI